MAEQTHGLCHPPDVYDEYQLNGARDKETHAIVEEGNHAIRVHFFADVLKDIQNGNEGERVRG